MRQLKLFEISNMRQKGRITELTFSVAKRGRDYRCEKCGRRIPVGARYQKDPLKESIGGMWYVSEHINCEEYRQEDMLPGDYNANWRQRALEEERKEKYY
jgi:hypothetical protein